MPARKSAATKKTSAKKAVTKAATKGSTKRPATRRAVAQVDAAANGSSAIVPRTVRRFGWVPDLPDHRDKMFSVSIVNIGQLPPSVDLRSVCPPVVYDQGELGSCTGNAIAAAVEFDQMKQGMADVFTPSRLFIYYNERVMEHTVMQDAGAMIRDGIKSVNKAGAPPEPMWPYSDANPGPFQKKPGARVYREAKKHPALLYQRLAQVEQHLKACLANGFPFVFGFSVYESFQSATVARTGRVPMPKPKEKQLGGHAVLAVGYDDHQRRFIVRNSWSDGWGMKGYFTIPYDYVLDENMADDFWTIKSVG
jgi:C1A family cysteine protease